MVHDGEPMVNDHVNDFRDIPWFMISSKLGIPGESKASWQKHALSKYDFGWSSPWHFRLPFYLVFGILSDIIPDILSGMLTCILSGILSATWHFHFSVLSGTCRYRVRVDCPHWRGAIARVGVRVRPSSQPGSFHNLSGPTGSAPQRSLVI